jgi:hypothetical protein
MPTLFKPRKEDDFPFVGIYRAVIKRVFVVILLAVVSLTIILGKGLY